jgi:hypothetical protein
VVEPQCIPLIAAPKAWSPGTDGPLTADVVYFDARTEAEFAKFKGKLKGAIVLTGPPRDVEPRFEPLARRKSDADLLQLADADPPSPAGRRGGSPERRAQMEFARKKLLFFSEEGAALLIDPSSQGDGGTLFVASASVPSAEPYPEAGNGGRRVSAWDADAPKTIPQLVASVEHYNRLVRMIDQGESLRMTVDLAVEFLDDDLMGYNTIAEIPGTDLKDELVMLGAHLDSWHSGTGATDNAAGVAVAMEAVRILEALRLKPRRTIRIALWTGEEQGLLGSRAYVSEHFARVPDLATLLGGGPARNPSDGDAKSESTIKPEHGRFAGYFNLDNGTGKIRGVYLQGNEAIHPVFRRWLQPFRDLGASTLSIANTGGTDHLSFDAVGLPGFQFIQDEVEYSTRTHHSNQDLYDRIQAEDMKQASVIMAAFIYNTAMQDEKLPRKPVSVPKGR